MKKYSKLKPLLIAISGSIKTVSTSGAILEHISESYHEILDIQCYDGISLLPHFNPELEEQLPAEVSRFRNCIEKADGLLIVSPEYVYSLPGSLKNAIEWLVSTVILSGKPTASIIAAASGMKAYESLNLILRTLEVVLPDTSTTLIQGAKGKINSNGKIIDSSVVLQIDKVIHSLLHSIESGNKKPTKYS